MEFRNKYSRLKQFTEPGNPIKNEYAGKLDKNKNLVIEKTGEINLYAYINSFAESVDINLLLARFVAGDKEALMQRAGEYLDLSNVPSNLNDYIEFQRSTEALFNTLPVEVKKQFGNNVVNFLSQVGEPSWNNIMNTSKDQINKEKDDIAKEVKKTNEKLVKEKVIENPGLDPVEPIKPIDGGITK